MTQDEIEDIVYKAGYIITYSPGKVTHAICTKHGKIVPVTSDDHSCRWIKLLKEMKNANKMEL
jgi:hypothetical protein